MSLRRSPSSLGSRLMSAVSQSAMVQLLGVRLDNLAGEVPQNQVTDLTDDLASKAGAGATTAALATKAATADLASPDDDKGAALVKLERNVTVQRALKSALNLYESGATGDGETDDQAEIQAFLDANVGKTILVPNGTFVIGSNIVLPSGTKLIGTGGTIKMSAAASILLALNGNEFVIDGLTIDKNDTENPAIWGFSTANSRITNNRILNCSAGNGILLRAQTSANGGTQDVHDNLISGNFLDCQGAHSVVSQIGIGIDADLNGQNGAAIWNASPGTLPTTTYYARNNRVIGNEIIGGNYAIGMYFATGNLISGNLSRDNGGGVTAPTGAIRGISMQNGSSQNTVVGNSFVNTQSASIHVAYGSVENLVSGNRMHNEIIDFGQVAPGSTVDGSQACIQVTTGAKRNTITGNKATILNDNSNAGAEFFVNIGPHCDGTTVSGNEFYGAVAKAGINVESTYESTSAIATSYAVSKGFSAADWASAALDAVTVKGNRLNLTTAKPAIQFIQAGAIDLTNVIEESNAVEGSFSTRFLKDQTTGTGSFSGKANWNNADEIELPQSSTINVFGGTNFKATTLGYSDIVAINGGTKGQVIALRMNGSGAVAASGAINLQGGANLVSSASARLHLRYDGSAWYETGRVE